MGFPLGEQLATTSAGIKADHQDGKISQTGDEYSFRHNAVSFGGASGSPVFNRYGKLIGVHHAGLTRAGIHGYAFAIKAKYAAELAK
jgi:S1-C subfamily serine protease